MRRRDVERLRDAGWSDVQIRDAGLDVSYFAAMNRLADGLGYGPDAEHRFATR